VTFAGREGRRGRSPVRIVRFGPTRTWFRPGTAATLEVEVVAARAIAARLTVELVELDRVVKRLERSVRLPAGLSIRRVRIALPAAERRGYGLRLVVRDRAGSMLATADEAVEAIDGWWQSPRHAAITRFADPARTAAMVQALRAWHVTVVQDYDWMYRHYRYVPPARDRLPGDSFVDALGRRVSHAAVRAGIRAGHEVGIATLAYGSVYGAEREYVDRHPDERVFDDAGRPLSLGEMFFINDVRRGHPWRRRLLKEYAGAVRTFAFDGIHMDTYGPPHHAVAADGTPIDFATEYPALIADGAAAIEAARPGARVLFNCVEGFPLDTVADAPAAAIYLELWPPDVHYADLVAWIDRARVAGGQRSIVIAAYLSCLRTHELEPIARAAAVEAAVLLTSVIAAAGAFHHVLADDRRVLVEGYYPEARQLRAGEAAELQAAWVFTSRYLHLLNDPASMAAPLDGVELVDAGGVSIAISSEPRAGAVWARVTRLTDGRRVLNLVDLRFQPDNRWDALRSIAAQIAGWRIRWPGSGELSAASPWSAAGRARSLTAGSVGVALPSFRRWLLVVDRPHRG
jgi:dextranase